MKSFSERKAEKENKDKLSVLKEAGGNAVTVKSIKVSPMAKALPYIYLLLGSLVIVGLILFDLGIPVVGLSCGLWVILGLWLLR